MPMITPDTKPIAAPQPSAEDEGWTMVIRPQGSWFDLKLGELWQYRDLVLLLVRRDFVASTSRLFLARCGISSSRS